MQPCQQSYNRWPSLPHPIWETWKHSTVIEDTPWLLTREERRFNLNISRGMKEAHTTTLFHWIHMLREVRAEAIRKKSTTRPMKRTMQRITNFFKVIRNNWDSWHGCTYVANSLVQYVSIFYLLREQPTYHNYIILSSTNMTYPLTSLTIQSKWCPRASRRSVDTDPTGAYYCAS